MQSVHRAVSLAQQLADAVVAEAGAAAAARVAAAEVCAALAAAVAGWRVAAAARGCVPIAGHSRHATSIC
jgi:hypothetical protein